MPLRFHEKQNDSKDESQLHRNPDGGSSTGQDFIVSVNANNSELAKYSSEGNPGLYYWVRIQGLKLTKWQDHFESGSILVLTPSILLPLNLNDYVTLTYMAMRIKTCNLTDRWKDKMK